MGSQPTDTEQRTQIRSQVIIYIAFNTETQLLFIESK